MSDELVPADVAEDPAALLVLLEDMVFVRSRLRVP